MKEQLLIGEEWCESGSGSRIEVINPATEETISTVPRGNAEDINWAVQAAHSAAIGAWRDLTPTQRGQLLYRVADALEAQREEFAELETLDVGKPLRQSRSDVNAAISYFRYYAGATDKIEGDSIPLGKNYVNYTVLEPLGVTGHIIPWNFPLSIASRSLAPALAAGNTVVVKPSELAPLTTLRLAAVCIEAGLPPGVINVVTGYGEEAGAPLVQHPLVRGITFTGSVVTGKAVLRMAADSIKTVVVELGGKSPQIVFADANLDKAVSDTIRGVFGNAGQICSASSRILLHRSIYDDYLKKLESMSRGLSIGPGMDDHDVGPLIAEQQYERVASYLQMGLTEGAELISGGKRPQHLSKGYFLQPSIFAGVQPQMRIAQEEIFGPVVCALSFNSDEEALEIANGVPYGLVAGIYTRDITRALRLARDIQAGQVWINEWFIGGVQTPFGGYKESGLGREKGLRALANYIQIKNVGIRI